MVETIDSTLKKVLSQANAEQNQSYPPRIVTPHYNITSDFLLDEVVRVFPGNNAIVRIASPFLVVKDVPVKDGFIEYPEDLRNLLTVAIFLSKDGKKACAPDITPEEAKKQRLDKRSRSKSVDQVQQFEFDDLTDHPYKAPTLQAPICCVLEGTGIRISPWDVPMVELRYLKHPKIYKYGYTMNPDDTYNYDPTKGEESEWDTTAASYLFKGMNILYANYVRDPEMGNSAQLLRQTGLI